MAFTESYTQSALSISTTELSLTGGTSTLVARTDDGYYAARIFIASMAAGDQFLIKVYEKLLSGSSQVAFWEIPILNAMSAPLYLPAVLLTHGWEFSAIKVAGTNRNLDFGVWRTA